MSAPLDRGQRERGVVPWGKSHSALLSWKIVRKVCPMDRFRRLCPRLYLPGMSSRRGPTVLSALIAATFLLGSNKLVAEENADGQRELAEGTFAADESPTLSQIKAWIEELGHDAYPLRQAAAEQLLRAGMSAREPLLKLADGPDPETRAAARRLVALIDRTEFHRRLEAFAADTEGRQGLTLPGWDRYRELVGDDTAARALFVEMQRQEGAMLSAAFGVSTQPVHELWEERLLRLIQWQATAGNRGAQPPLGSAAAMLFLGSIADVNVSDRSAMMVEHLIQRPPIREALQAGDHRDAIRRLIVGWVLHCPNENESLLGRRIYLASTNGLKEALPLALAVAGGDPKYASVQPSTRAAAILMIGHLGGREHIEQLEPLLNDSTICMPRVAQAAGQPANVQIRDVALVVLLNLTDQQPADYGYLHARMQSQRLFQVQTLHVENDAQRARAVAKWRAWRAAEKNRESDAEQNEPVDDGPS